VYLVLNIKDFEIEFMKQLHITGRYRFRVTEYFGLAQSFHVMIKKIILEYK